MTIIIDYGAGNLHSVKNALDFLGEENNISSDVDEILSAERLILPGVGSFGDAMKSLTESGLDSVIRTATANGTPFLGICLGLQLLFDESEESPNVKGLGILKGKFVKIPKIGDIKIPHMGWNSITLTKPSVILNGLGDEPFVYFVHSYYLKAENHDDVSAFTEYGSRLDIAVEHGNVFATQFHPEKSGDTGMKILRNFIAVSKGDLL